MAFNVGKEQVKDEDSDPALCDLCGKDASKCSHSIYARLPKWISVLDDLRGKALNPDNGNNFDPGSALVSKAGKDELESSRSRS